MLKTLIAIVLFIGVAMNARSESLAVKTNWVEIEKEINSYNKILRVWYVDFSSIGPDKEEPQYISLKHGARDFLGLAEFKGKKAMSSISINVYDCSYGGRSKNIEVEEYSTDIPSPSSVIYKSVRPDERNGGFKDLWSPLHSDIGQKLLAIACGKLKRSDFK